MLGMGAVGVLCRCLDRYCSQACHHKQPRLYVCVEALKDKDNYTFCHHFFGGGFVAWRYIYMTKLPQ